MTDQGKIKVSTQILFFSAIGLVSFLLRLPILYNADLFLNSDEAFNALIFIEMLQEKKVLLYHENPSYHGVVEVLLALPLFATLGFTALSCKLTAVFIYLGVVISSYFLAREIFSQNVAAITALLLAFPTPFLLNLSTYFFPHLLIVFLGNVVFIYFIRLSREGFKDSKKIFYLGFWSGFSIYAFMMIILHLAAMAVIFFKKYFYRMDARAFVKKKIAVPGKVDLLMNLLDLVIYCFCAAIAFSLVFGGFSIDIATWSVFQIHSIYPPMAQLAGLLLARGLFLKDRKAFFRQAKEYFAEKRRTLDRRVFYFLSGAVLGFSPRLIYLVTGKISRGGDFVEPNIDTQIFYNLYKYFSYCIPEGLGVDRSLFPERFVSFDAILYYAVFAFFAFFLSSYLISRRKNIREIFSSREKKFDPEDVVLVFILIMSLAIVFNSRDPQPRHIGTLLVFFIMITAYYMEKWRRSFVPGFGAVLFLFLFWNVSNTYKNYERQGIVSGRNLMIVKDPLLDAIAFMKEKNIRAGYADYWVAHRINFFEKKEILFSEYTDTPRSHNIHAKLKDANDFAIVAMGPEVIGKYHAFLAVNEIVFKEQSFGPYGIFYDFQGNASGIQELKRIG